MIFFTSDLHFCHNQPFIYKDRGFSSIEEHDTAIINNWNRIVSPEDTVYILGDLMLNDNEQGIKNINQLQGNLFILLGNHDTDARLRLYGTHLRNLVCCSYAMKEKINGYSFWLSHYPTDTSNMNEINLKRVTLDLHGHTHSKEIFQSSPYQYNVALDAHNMCPVSIEQVISDIQQKRYQAKKEGEE